MKVPLDVQVSRSIAIVAEAIAEGEFDLAERWMAVLFALADVTPGIREAHRGP